ncbi:MAG: hypothetical protein HGB35_03435 [Geobacteraceae bacterium]|nr:hypothetical protein [Geobacteraceae bacterium]
MSTRKKPENLQQLETIIVLAAFLLLLNLISHRSALVIAAFVLMLIGLFAKPVAGIISRSWLKFAELLGAANSRILLFLIFFLFLTPLALLFRMFTKNPLQLKRVSDLQSLYVERNHLYSRTDFKKMW